MIIRVLALAAIILVYVPITARAEDAGLVAAIRAEVNEINRNVPAHAKQSKVVLDVSAEGAEVEYYHDREKARKISAKIYGETYRSEAEFYYRGDELLFVYENSIAMTRKSVRTLRHRSSARKRSGCIFPQADLPR